VKIWETYNKLCRSCLRSLSNSSSSIMPPMHSTGWGSLNFCELFSCTNVEIAFQIS
jgi:hypothetical protein